MTRNKIHELIMQVIYIELTLIAMKNEIDISSIMEGIYKLPYQQIDPFSKEVVIETTKHMNDIVPVIENNLKDWKYKRLPRLTQAILLMSYAHYKYVEKVDKAIVIEVAVKLSKKYLDKNDHRFINGVLDNIL